MSPCVVACPSIELAGGGRWEGEITLWVAHTLFMGHPPPWPSRSYCSSPPSALCLPTSSGISGMAGVIVFGVPLGYTVYYPILYPVSCRVREARRATNNPLILSLLKQKMLAARGEKHPRRVTQNSDRCYVIIAIFFLVHFTWVLSDTLFINCLLIKALHCLDVTTYTSCLSLITFCWVGVSLQRSNVD